MKVAVFGSTGYSGQVLLRLLLNHPAVEKIWAVSSSRQSTPIAESDGGLSQGILNTQGSQGKLANEDSYSSPEEAQTAKPDAVFLALPHGKSTQSAEAFLGNSVIFDLSADMRLNSPQTHKTYYGVEAPLPDWRSRTVYGLPELHREALQSADLVAMPGCYPTSVLLPLTPMARAGLLKTRSCVVVNSLSGISGAGRTARFDSLYTERSENAIAYSPGQTHRHHPEMLQELSKAGSQSPLLFTPHLIPMRRGLLSTISFTTHRASLEESIHRLPGTPHGTGKSTRNSTENSPIGLILESAYGSENFIRLTGQRLPSTANVRHSNRRDIGWSTTETSNDQTAVTLFSTIDNLMKGASGQALQAMNIRFSLPETSGLPLSGQI